MRQSSTPTIDRPLKPVADVFMFIEDKKSDYKKKYPMMDDNELQRFMVKEFNCISERDKVLLQSMPYLSHSVNPSLPYLWGGQVITPAQRWGRISSAQCATPM